MNTQKMVIVLSCCRHPHRAYCCTATLSGGADPLTVVDATPACHDQCRQDFCKQFAVRTHSINPHLQCCFDLPAVVKLYDSPDRGDRVPVCERCFEGFADLLQIVDKYVSGVHPPASNHVVASVQTRLSWSCRRQGLLDSASGPLIARCLLILITLFTDPNHAVCWHGWHPSPL